MPSLTRPWLKVAVRRSPTRGAIVALACLLAACHGGAPATDDARPVRTLVVTAAAANATFDLPGEVRPHIESRLGFRVGGKLVSRKVDLGQVVHTGQVLAVLDPQDLKLAQASAKAQLESAESSKRFAEDDYKRYQDLFNKHFISQAELDRRKTTLDSAAATYDQALASYRTQSNQAGYSLLVADADGVVTGVDAEPGQVVSSGQSVIRIARTRDKEVWVAVPEDRVDGVRALKTAEIALWALPGARLKSTIREVAAAADPATRTYTVKLSLDDAPPAVRIGMTAVATFSVATPSGMALRLPLTALTQREGRSAVWIVDGQTSTVSLAPVQLAGPLGNDVLVASGLAPGQRVVTAGVNLLQPGQKVKVLDASNDPARVLGSSTAAAAAAAAPAGAHP